MKIGELLDELSQTGNTIASVAKEKVGIAEKRLKGALHNAGYGYRVKSPRGWFYTGEGEQPLDNSIHDFVSSSVVKERKKSSSHKNSPSVKQARKEISHSVKEVASTVTHLDEIEFTNVEMKALKEMAQAFLAEKEYQTKRDVLHKRIMMLEKEEKVRKTIVISENVGALLDKFAESSRFNKSDLLEIAIMDLVNRYE